MLIDGLIVLGYFILILAIALSGRGGVGMSSEEYFLSSRNLRWPSIAISTIATNIQGYQFLGMMGSAYLFGLAQASLEINAVEGLLLAAFVFVPLYLKDRVITVTQFINKRLGDRVGLFYSLANLGLLSTVGLGAALFWGAYAADLVFGDLLSFISDNQLVRIGSLVILLGVFSAIYTFFGGLSAVVRTDLIQFTILVIGGTVVLFTAIQHLGGWDQLYIKTPELMHLHLPKEHPTLPWIHIFGLFLLNINYWCANQSIVQRSLAARNLREAQIGLLVGGVMKYFMAVLIVVPGIALAGILAENPLSDPDVAFPYLVKEYLPAGLRGLILCALFASLMSTVDSLFNSLSTLWTIDIYQKYLRPTAKDEDLVRTGRRTILVTLFTGISMGLILIYVKFENPELAFTHTLNELRYYINCGIVVVICAAAALWGPNQRLALVAFLSTIPLHLLLQYLYPEMNYFVRAGWVILLAFLLLFIPTLIVRGRKTFYPKLLVFADQSVRWMALGLLISLIFLHLLFH